MVVCPPSLSRPICFMAQRFQCSVASWPKQRNPTFMACGGVTISCALNGSLRRNKTWTHMLVNVLRRSVTDLAQCKLTIRPPFEWQASLGDPQHPQHPKYPARALHLTGRALEILIRLSSCSIFISQSDGYWPDSNSSLLSN